MIYADVAHAVTRIEERIKAAPPEVRRVFVEVQSGEAHRRGQAAMSHNGA